MLRDKIRRACQTGALGFLYPADFAIRECIRWKMLRHERATVEYLRRLMKPGGMLIDVGAHVGYYAAYAGRLVGPTGCIVAFEPHPVNYQYLVQNCRNMPQVKTIQAAVSDSCGSSLLFEHVTSSSSHGFTDLSGNGRSIPVRTVTIDDQIRELGLQRIDAVIIDVEGHERSVLRGMRRLVENNRLITIILEYCPSHWAQSSDNITFLIDEIYEMKLGFRSILGQSKRYALQEYASSQELVDYLDRVIVQEHNNERCDYVNVVIQNNGT